MAHIQQQASTDVFAGIDWGGSFHQLCLVDADGTVLRQKRFLHTAEGLDALCQALITPDGTVRAAIERAEGLLVERLLTLGIDVFAVSPKISARARERYRVAAKKQTRSTRSSSRILSATNTPSGDPSAEARTS